jgi:hypothetical protein
MKKDLLSYLTPLTAIGLAGIAAIISIIGMSKLFSGQETIVMVVMSFIELGKIISTSILHNNWVNEQYNKIRWFLLTMVFVTMLITSLGVYGFFTDAYQKTSSKLSVTNSEIILVENKKKLINNRIENIANQVGFKEKQSVKLLELRNQQESRLDSLIKNKNFTTAKRTQDLINSTNEDLKTYQLEIEQYLTRINNLNDSISKLDVEILEKNSNNEASSKLGPLMYISALVKKDMVVVVNYLMLLIMFVFDPLAIILILITNKMWSKTLINEVKSEMRSETKIDNGVINNDNQIEYEYGDIEEDFYEDFVGEIEDGIDNNIVIETNDDNSEKEDKPVLDKIEQEPNKKDFINNETWRKIYLKRRKKDNGDNNIKRF